MRFKGKTLLAPLALVLALTAVVAAGASTTSITITSPKAGSSFSLKRTPTTSLTGAVSFSATTPTASRFYLRRDGCGTSNDNPHLSVVNGTDGGDGCGLTLTSIVGPGGIVDENASVDFPSSDGMPLSFDASRTVTGTIDLESFGLVDPLAAGVGDLTVTVSMEALYQGEGVSIGSDSESVILTPTAADYPVNFTIQPNSALDQADLSGIDLRVHVEGPFVFSGFIGNSGKSFADVPAYAASTHKSVQISVDDPTFANPTSAQIGPTGSTWSASIPTPALGSHTIYAESTQGFDTSAPASTTFTVKR